MTVSGATIYHIRNATLEDTSNLQKLLMAFMQETFHRPWGGTLQKLEQDGLKMLVVESTNY